MALEHALLVSLREKPAAGLELARRFEASIGFFWSATHQQIYKVLHRMAADGWVEVGLDTHPSGALDQRPDTHPSGALDQRPARTRPLSALDQRPARLPRPAKEYRVTTLGEQALAEWIAGTTPNDALRNTLAVKIRGASYGDRAAVLREVGRHLAEHNIRLAHYESLERRDYPEPSTLSGQELDHYLVLRGGILSEQFWTQWLTEYLEAHSS